MFLFNSKKTLLFARLIILTASLFMGLAARSSSDTIEETEGAQDEESYVGADDWYNQTQGGGMGGDLRGFDLCFGFNRQCLLDTTSTIAVPGVDLSGKACTVVWSKWVTVKKTCEGFFVTLDKGCIAKKLTDDSCNSPHNETSFCPFDPEVQPRNVCDPGYLPPIR